MKIVVPYIGELHSVDMRLVRLAEFMGVESELVPIERLLREGAEDVETAVSQWGCALVANPQVLREVVHSEVFPDTLAKSLLARFRFVLVHCLEPSQFDNSLISALSGGALREVSLLHTDDKEYNIDRHSQDICHYFAGLTLGPVQPSNDRTFIMNRDTLEARTTISIGKQPFMSIVKSAQTEVMFIASKDVVDLEKEVTSTFLNEAFSQFIPQALALRRIGGNACWLPGGESACLIIDDPVLRRRYGFLNFNSLVEQTIRHKFHASIAFIPQNYERNESSITALFVKQPSRLSLCYHGNDHTAAEFAATAGHDLSSMLKIAKARMSWHTITSGVACDRVMIFPYGLFSAEAMAALQCNGFRAAVSSIVYPAGRPLKITLREYAEPAILRYGGFPLFHRRGVAHIRPQDIAFNLFFGKPVLIGGHHEDFRNPEDVARVAETVSRIAPNISWSNLARIAAKAYLAREESDGTTHIKAYSETVQLDNDVRADGPTVIEWPARDKLTGVTHMEWRTINAQPFEAGPTGLAALPELAARQREVRLLRRGPEYRPAQKPQLMRRASAILRGRLRELKANYLVGNPHAIRLAGKSTSPLPDTKIDPQSAADRK